MGQLIGPAPAPGRSRTLLRRGLLTYKTSDRGVLGSSWKPGQQRAKTRGSQRHKHQGRFGKSGRGEAKEVHEVPRGVLTHLSVTGHPRRLGKGQQGTLVKKKDEVKHLGQDSCTKQGLLFSGGGPGNTGCYQKKDKKVARPNPAQKPPPPPNKHPKKRRKKNNKTPTQKKPPPTPLCARCSAFC